MSKPTPSPFSIVAAILPSRSLQHTHEGMGTYVCLGNLSLASWADCAIPRSVRTRRAENIDVPIDTNGA